MIATIYRFDYGILALQVVIQSTVKVHVNRSFFFLSFFS
jgi:hypothetical protein